MMPNCSHITPLQKLHRTAQLENHQEGHHVLLWYDPYHKSDFTNVQGVMKKKRLFTRTKLLLYMTKSHVVASVAEFRVS